MDGTISAGGVGYFIFEGDSRSNFVIQQNAALGDCDCSAFRFVNGAHHVRLKNLTMKNFTGNGIIGSGTTPAVAIEIVANEIRNNGNFGPLNGPYEHGIYPSKSADWLIEGNYLVGNFAFGVHMYNSNTNGNMRATIRNNTIEGRQISSGTTACIVVSSGSGHTIYNNLCIGQGSQPAKHTIGIALSYANVSAEVYNNTVYDVSVGLQTINASNVTIKNNLFNATSDNFNINNSTSITGSNNLCTANDTDVSGACTIVTSAPGFLTLGSNFRLAAGSVATDAGATISTVTKDLDGMVRPNGAAYDIGAYEGSGASLPPPSPPRNLSVR
jgi:hypothetical protein